MFVLSKKSSNIASLNLMEIFDLLKNTYIMNVAKVMADLEAKHPGEKEFLQAVHEVLESIEEVYNQQDRKSVV